MKKKELMTLVPPEMTPYLRKKARQDTPVKSQYWASEKNINMEDIFWQRRRRDI